MQQNQPIHPCIKTGLDIVNEARAKIAFQVPAIDKLLRGGIRLAGLTEISGEAGSGKTQLAMNLCLTAQLPKALGGLHKKTLYISTEGPCATERVLQMARNLIQRHRLKVTATEMLENFIYISVFEHEDLLNLIKARLERLFEMEPIGLVIIDSVAAVFRLHAEYINRAQNMRVLVTTLQRLGKQHHFGLVCINQVRSSMDSSETAPALGLSWANLVTTRLQIYKQRSVMGEDGEIVQRRTLRVTWAPNLPTDSATFYISGEGIL